MRFSTRLSDALHILVLVAMSDGSVSSAQIAESVRTHPSFVRQLVGKLKAAGIVTSTRGKPCTALARPAEEISMLDVYRAVEGNKLLLHLDIHTNPECGAGVNIQYVLGEYYEDVQRATCEEMSKIRLADIIARCKARIAERRTEGPDSAVDCTQ